MEVQFITDGKGKKLAAILPLKEYNKILKKLEDAKELDLYDKLQAREQKFISAEEMFNDIERKRKRE